MPSESQPRAKVLGRVEHNLPPRRHETAREFAQRVRSCWGISVATCPVARRSDVQGANILAAHRGVVVFRFAHLDDPDTRTEAAKGSGIPFEGLAEETSGAIAALRAELEAGRLRKRATQTEALAAVLARACLAAPGALAAIEAGDGHRLALALNAPGVTIESLGGAPVVVVNPRAARRLGCRAGQCPARDVFAAVGRINRIGGAS